MKDFDFLGTHVPANKTAKNVLSAGVHYEYKNKDKNKFHSETPEKIIKPNNPDQGFIDYTGHKHGSFTVIGRVKNRNGCGRWLCKCSCGNYEQRSSKSIKNHIDNPEKYDPDICVACADLRKIKIMATAKSMGYEYKEYCEKFLPRRNHNKSIDQS